MSASTLGTPLTRPLRPSLAAREGVIPTSEALGLRCGRIAALEKSESTKFAASG